MKSSFSRSFYPAVLIMLTALLAVGMIFQVLARNIIEKRALDQLQTEAQTISGLVSAYHSIGAGLSDDLYINISVVSRVSGADTVICDLTGRVVLCSGAPMGCEHLNLRMEKSFVNGVVHAGTVRNTGLLQGLYEQKRFVVAVAVLDSDQNPIGIVMTSKPSSDMTAFLHSMTNFYLVASGVSLVLAVLVMGWVARYHSAPLKKLRKAAVDFGHGNLDARVSLSGSHPEEVEELALAFNNMAESLQQSENRRQEFVANVSHELKTPMTTISGFADGILDGTIAPEKQEHYLKMISDETKRLNRLVRSMLDATRLQEKEGIPEDRKQRFDLGECAGQVLLGFEQKITGKNLDVQVHLPDYPVYTWAQQDHIVQVLYNLVDNAVKFCPEQGVLELGIRTGGSKIYVYVANSGQTIPPEELPLVFDRFHKLDKSRSENRDSWGLGLYIVKTIIGAHGENISVVSRDGRTQFTFTLPLVN